MRGTSCGQAKSCQLRRRQSFASRAELLHWSNDHTDKMFHTFLLVFLHIVLVPHVLATIATTNKLMGTRTLNAVASGLQ